MVLLGGLELMGQHSQSTMVTTSLLPGDGRAPAPGPSPLAARAPCVQPVFGVGGLCALLMGALYDLTQLLGIVIGVFLALALIGTTIFFVYRRVSQFREYLA